MEISELLKYEVPESLVSELRKKGYSKLTAIQELAIKSDLFEGQSLVISAPTNTGKTFIAELAIINAAVFRKLSKTFYLLPLKALAEEKFNDFQDKYSDWGLQVAISTGERSEFDAELDNYDVILATYEKLLTLLIRYPNLIEQIGVVIFDELQNIADPYRGVNIELLLSMLITQGKADLQIIALSATTPNANEIADWLRADLVTSSIREVELREGIAYTGDKSVKFHELDINKGDFIFKEYNTGKISIERNFDINSFDFIIPLSNSEQIIIFVSKREEAEQLATRFSEHMESSKTDSYLREMELRIDPTPTTIRLSRCLQNGVGFHHAGLLSSEKEVVERAFFKGDISIICATTTLAAGVNTPAKNIVFRSHQFWGGDLPVVHYKNMAGRAGRIFHHDDFGRSILFAANEKDLRALWNRYIEAVLEPIESQILKYGEFGLPLLIILSFFNCKKINEILSAIENTFFGYKYAGTEDVIRKAFEKSILKEIQFLNENNFLDLSDDVVEMAEIGRCCVAELISPLTAITFLEGLTKVNDNLEAYPDLIETIICLICNTYDARSSLLYARNRKKLSKYARNNIHKYVVYERDQELLLRSIFTTQMLLEWIDGISYNELKI